MMCPFCQGESNRVVDSRLAREGKAVRRRRHCELCDERFTTYEVVETAMVEVIKRDGTTELFEPEKFLRSLRLACSKRPIDTETLSRFVDRTKAHFSTQAKRRVTSVELGDAALHFLRDADAVAYVRYASVYRSFDSVAAFMRELEALSQPAPPA